VMTRRLPPWCLNVCRHGALTPLQELMRPLSQRRRLSGHQQMVRRRGLGHLGGGRVLG